MTRVVRPETAEDAEIVERLYDEAYAGDPYAQQVAGLRPRAQRLERLCLVCEVDGDVVGHVTAARAHVDGEPAVAVVGAAVSPRYQQRGAGRALVTGVLANAESLDERVVVVAGPSGWLRALGWRPAAEEDVVPPTAPPGEVWVARIGDPAAGPRGALDVPGWGDPAGAPGGDEPRDDAEPAAAPPPGAVPVAAPPPVAPAPRTSPPVPPAATPPPAPPWLPVVLLVALAGYLLGWLVTRRATARERSH
jgi:predicted N-acetyltransferase YhbS